MKISIVAALVALMLRSTAAAAQLASPGTPYLSNDRALTRQPSRRFCSEETVPIGRLRGEAEAQFVLSADGRADTASVIVLRSVRISPETARSAVARMLAACQFRPGEAGRLPVSTIVVQRIEFDELKIQVKNGRTPPILEPTPASLSPVLAIVPDSVYLDSDPLVEERPTKISCPQSGPITYLNSERIFSRAGAVQISFIVLANGRPDPGSIVVDLGMNAQVVADDTREILACTYLPGRVRGRPVNVRTFHEPLPPQRNYR